MRSQTLLAVGAGGGSASQMSLPSCLVAGITVLADWMGIRWHTSISEQVCVCLNVSYV